MKPGAAASQPARLKILRLRHLQAVQGEAAKRERVKERVSGETPSPSAAPPRLILRLSSSVVLNAYATDFNCSCTHV